MATMMNSKTSETNNRKSNGHVRKIAAPEVAPLDVHDELAALLNYIGDFAMRIRFLGQHKRQDLHAFSDVVWLGDSLHKLHHLGEAIRLQDRQAIANACDWLIADHESYQSDSESQAAFSRNSVRLDEAVRIFEAIKSKVA
jgi:hypothetical protein